ncbi:MAG: cellulase family glycosylhydrolase [Candidatus Eremiobacteraeota bacterium]|nr:cellulase family glycosylhydrolase [Candidatus Eremiobacteraeota bacterium]
MVNVRKAVTGITAAALIGGLPAFADGATRVSTESVPSSRNAALPKTSIVRRAATLSGIRVSGNHLVDGNQNVVHLQGVNRSGTEYACIQGWGIFDGPSDAKSVAAIASWNSNIVRVLLNEDCWLDINGVKQQYAGANYQSAIVNYVNLLHSYGMYAEVSLMFGAPGNNQATYQPPAPDEDHAPAMWSSMAATFKSDPNVILAPWGETTVDWTCFMKTGCDNEAQWGSQYYLTAPMQQAVNVMRANGYNGVISIPCIDYANMCAKYDGSSWLKSHPSDPANELIAEAHVYGKNTCDTVACFNSTMKPLTQQFPLIFGETGETYDASNCSAKYIATFLNWADVHGVGYEAWTWDTWGGCGVLIKDYNGTPASAWARWVRNHYLGKR